MKERVVDWDIEVQKYLGSLRGKELKWGKTDCYSMLFGCLGVMLVDPPEKPGDIYSRESAIKIAKKVDPVEFLLELGAEEIQPSLSTAGDIAIKYGEELPAIGIVAYGGMFLVEDKIFLGDRKQEGFRYFRV